VIPKFVGDAIRAIVVYFKQQTRKGSILGKAFMKRIGLLMLFCWLIAALPLAAQAGAPLVALVSSSGQLIISSGDGSSRWIVTNPGETITGIYAWSGSQLIFGVDQGGSTTALRRADAANQNVSDLGAVEGQALSMLPSAAAVFYRSRDGSYGMQATGGQLALPLTNDASAHYSGLWSDNGRLIAYWGYAGNSILAVTNVASGDTLTLDSGRSTPITPLAWRPGTTELIYRDASGTVRLTDLGCMMNSCGANPLENGTALASADADVVTDGRWLYFRSGNTIGAVNLNCVSADSCLNSAVTIAADAAPQSTLHVAGRTLIYTGYASNPNDPGDRQVQVVDLSCLSSSCSPQTVLPGAVAGAISANGRYAVVEVSQGLEALDLTSGTTAYLSDHGAPLDSAVWQS
jgi:hypothetical protein